MKRRLVASFLVLFAIWPLLHHAAYAQARLGGAISTSFAGYGSLPVRRKQPFPLPAMPPLLEWKADLYDHAAFGHAFDHVLVRTFDALPTPSPTHPFRLVYGKRPWFVYETLPSRPR